MDTRSVVVRKPIDQPFPPGRNRAIEHAWSATLTKNRAWPTPKRCFRRDAEPVAGALFRGRTDCRLKRKRPRTVEMARRRPCRALQAAILSGVPTTTAPSLSARPIFGPKCFRGSHHRRSQQLPLAREDIPDNTRRLANLMAPPSPDVISSMISNS